jgi:hypothetical protein
MSPQSRRKIDALDIARKPTKSMAFQHGCDHGERTSSCTVGNSFEADGLVRKADGLI